VVEAAKHLQTLQAEGLVRHIGVTDMPATDLAAILDAGVPVTTAQAQYSLLDHRPQTKLAALCRERNVKLVAYGVLAGGFISDVWLHQPEPTVRPAPARPRRWNALGLTGPRPRVCGATLLPPGGQAHAAHAPSQQAPRRRLWQLGALPGKKKAPIA